MNIAILKRATDSGHSGSLCRSLCYAGGGLNRGSLISSCRKPRLKESVTSTSGGYYCESVSRTNESVRVYSSASHK